MNDIVRNFDGETIEVPLIVVKNDISLDVPFILIFKGPCTKLLIGSKLGIQESSKNLTLFPLLAIHFVFLVHVFQSREMEFLILE